jgi:hypothetical protein
MLLLAMAFPSLLVVLDLGLSFLCHRVPLLWYLAAGGIGVVIGPVLGAQLHGDGPLRRLFRGLVITAVGVGVHGAIWMAGVSPIDDGFGFPPPWDSKCAWRYCGRALGPSLSRSPYSVGTPSCDALHMCASEYPYSDDERRQLLTRMREQGCTPP